MRRKRRKELEAITALGWQAFTLTQQGEAEQAKRLLSQLSHYNNGPMLVACAYAHMVIEAVLPDRHGRVRVLIEGEGEGAETARWAAALIAAEANADPHGTLKLWESMELSEQATVILTLLHFAAEVS